MGCLTNFDVIIGNPPYQMNDGGGNGSSAVPLYNKFVEKSMEGSELTCMIIPSRWFGGGRGLDGFRKRILNGNGIRKIVDYMHSKDCFGEVDIVGGVNYFLWDKKYFGQTEIRNISHYSNACHVRSIDEFDILVRDNIACRIIGKVRANCNVFLNDSVLTSNPFGFKSSYRNLRDKGQLTLFHSSGKCYVDLDEVTKNNEIVEKFKVSIGKVVPGNGEVSINPEVGYKVITRPKIYKPGEIFSESYLCLKHFDSEEEAINFKSYCSSKIFRFLLKQCLSSMNISKKDFRFIPEIDYREDFCKEDFYNYLGLDANEISYIEMTMRGFDQ